MLPWGGEKHKKKKTLVQVVNDDIVEVAGPSGSKTGEKAGAGAGTIAGVSGQAFLERLDRLVRSVDKLTREVRKMASAQRSVAQSNDWVSSGIKMLLEECQFFTAPFETEEEETDSEEDADAREVTKEVKELNRELQQAGDELLPHFPAPRQ